MRHPRPHARTHAPAFLIAEPLEARRLMSGDADIWSPAELFLLDGTPVGVSILTPAADGESSAPDDDMYDFPEVAPALATPGDEESYLDDSVPAPDDDLYTLQLPAREIAADGPVFGPELQTPVADAADATVAPKQAEAIAAPNAPPSPLAILDFTIADPAFIERTPTTGDAESPTHAKICFTFSLPA